MRDWEILLNVAWPHERCRLGWEILQPTEEQPYITIMVDIFIIAIQFNYE